LILVDANLLIYASVTELPQHAHASTWLEDTLNSGKRVGLAWESLAAFLRITTNPRIFQSPARLSEAWATVEYWLEQTNVWNPGATERHQKIFAECLRQVPRGGNLVPDAHLAALALEHGLTLYTCDSDFAKFAGLSWVNPIPVL
jgi:toxin-antitoxin system PIN domain toxin